MATVLADNLETSEVAFFATTINRPRVWQRRWPRWRPTSLSSSSPPAMHCPVTVRRHLRPTIGRWVAALRRLRMLQSEKNRQQIACIFSGEAAARRYPPPTAFDQAPPSLQIGNMLDMGTFENELMTIGYIVDEPREIAVRGEVIDIFPVDARSWLPA